LRTGTTQHRPGSPAGIAKLCGAAVCVSSCGSTGDATLLHASLAADFAGGLQRRCIDGVAQDEYVLWKGKEKERRCS
jgi:hypothetical protein